jgi:hypothetical protein
VRLNGLVLDLGDAVLHTELIVKGRRLGITWHIGAPQDTTPEDRVPGNSNPALAGRKADVVMDLKADKKVTFQPGKFFDEMENEVPAPDGLTVAYSVSDGSVVNLTDNGDGTCEVAAIGVLGQSILHAEANAPGLSPIIGDELVNVVAGDAQRMTLQAGEPTEVTPDV